jgi:hypothetical protein
MAQQLDGGGNQWRSGVSRSGGVVRAVRRSRARQRQSGVAAWLAPV